MLLHGGGVPPRVRGYLLGGIFLRDVDGGLDYKFGVGLESEEQVSRFCGGKHLATWGIAF